MRACLLCLAIASSGCGTADTGGPDLSVAGDLRGAADLSASAGDLGGVDLAAHDLSSDLVGDLAGDLTPGPDQSGVCTTACDCPPGLGCAAGKCMVEFVAVYCCTSQTCPMGAQCDFPDGRNGTCGANACAGMMCNNDTQCIKAGCVMCDQTMNIPKCK